MPSLFARHRDSSPPAVSRIIRQLLRKRLITVSVSATDGRQRILDKQPQAMHERTPLIIGSKDEVSRVLSF